MTAIARLRTADPVTWLRDETDVDAPPPADVLARIVAMPPPEPPPRRRSRPLTLVALPVAAAVVTGLVLWLLPSSSDRVDLAAKAYAATAPGDAVTYTELRLERTMPPGVGGAQRDSIRDRIWQHGDRSHKQTTVVVTSGSDEGRRWNYEYDTNGNRLRILNPDGTVDTIRQGDPGWKTDEPRLAIQGEQQTIVERFRERYADARLRDAGETTFAGRPAHAYEVEADPKPPKPGQPADSPMRETFYLDPDSGLPLGSHRMTLAYGDGQVDPRTRRPRSGAKPELEFGFTEIVDRYERLAVTPENLAKLDAPAIDAGKPNEK